MVEWGTVGIIAGLSINVLVGGIGWGRTTQKLSDLSEYQKKQNGRLDKIEEKEENCKLDVTNRLTALEIANHTKKGVES